MYQRQELELRGFRHSTLFGAPVGHIHRWERLLIIRFWPDYSKRNYLVGDTTTNWDADPAAWSTSAGQVDLEHASREAADYVYNLVDRQLAKASGLLSLNSVLLAVFTLGMERVSGLAKVAAVVGSCMCLISAGVLVKMLLVRWGTAEQSASHRCNLRMALVSAITRTRHINFSGYASVVALVTALIFLVGFVRATS